MIETIEGIVLKVSDYKENSKILQLFTKEHGLIGIYLKGANSYKNANYQLAHPISHASFRINYHEGLSSCYQGEVLTAFNHLKIDFNKNIYIFHLYELLLKTLEQHQAHPSLFDLLLEIQIKSESISDDDVIKMLIMFFEIKLLYFSGVAPVLEHCVECGSSEYIVNFDIQKGGFICKKCLDLNSRTFSVDTLKVFYQYYCSVFNESLFNSIHKNTIKELRTLLSEYYYYHLGFKSNSSKFFT